MAVAVNLGNKKVLVVHVPVPAVPQSGLVAVLHLVHNLAAITKLCLVRLDVLAVKSALSDKVNNSELYVLEEITLAAPKTKEVLNIINSFNVGDAKVLFITEGDVNVERSARNIQGVKALACEGMNIFDLLHYDKLFITKGAVAKIEEVLG